MIVRTRLHSTASGTKGAKKPALKGVLGMMMNEAETRARLVEPKLKAAGWTDNLLAREFIYSRDYQFTEGKVILIGDEVQRGRKKKVDYLLRYSDGFPIAVVEAEPANSPPEAGLEQAKGYARDLRLAFAYSTNGHEIVEYDFFTHSSRSLKEFPKPQELWERWKVNTGLEKPTPGRVKEAPLVYGISEEISKSPLLYPYCPESLCGKRPFYFQEIAIREVILRVMRGQKRILLAMATGTGKTFIAFQIVWKLIKSGWFQRQHPERPARILFLTDRLVLRDQAYNTFSPFATGTSEPRCIIEGHPPNLNRDLYFGIYQTLWSPDENGKRLFEKFPPDFFDMVIIDECHRSGWGTWREILDHFSNAIHLGMTATPKQDENIDTYAYFCAEEEEVAIDPEHPEKGTWRPPAFQYSLGQGIEDGFLATYKVHLVRTTVDKDGLRLEDAIEQGAEVFIPEGVIPREVYTTPQFEREITLPDRTEAMVKHLANLLRRFGHMEKTMVFCVDMEHARLVARLLQDEFGPETGLDNYAVPIISEEGEARRWLEDFADPDKKAPVVATTAELLTTGVDVPSCRNIVFMKTISSPVLFKQIIGRGSRIDPATGKYWFRIIDFTGATRLFDEWDRPPGPPPETPKGPFNAKLVGKVFHAETKDLLVGASVTVRTGPNSQVGPIRTDSEGRFEFDKLPEGTLTLIVSAPGFVRREIKVTTLANREVSIDVPLRPERGVRAKIRVKGIEVTIADEAIFTVDATGQQLSLEEYRDYARRKVIQIAPTHRHLREIWVEPNRRSKFLEELRQSSIHPEVLAEVMGRADADAYDILAHITYGAPIRSRDERVIAFRNREQAFILQHNENARRVILELLDKYRVGGIEQIGSEVFNVSPFREWGGAFKISQWFGGVDELRKSLEEIRKRLYPLEEVGS